MAGLHFLNLGINQILNWLRPPIFEDANTTRSAALLNQILLISAGLWFGITTLLILTQQVATQNNILFSYLSCVLLLGLREILRRGHVRTTAILLPLLFWAGTAILQFQLGAIHSTHIIGYVLACATATLLIGRAAGMIVGLGSGLTIILLEYASMMGWLPPEASLPPANQPIVFIGDLTVLYVIIAVARESLNGALRSAEEELAQRRKAEEDLRQLNAHLDEIVSRRTGELEISEERFRSIFENAPFAYQSLDADGRFTFTNSNLCNLLGYQREELLGRPFNEVWPAEKRGLFPKTFAEFKENGQVHADLQLQRKDGKTIFTILEGRIQHNLDGQFVRSHCILTDVTEKQALQARIQRQNELLSALSHSTLEFLQFRDAEQLLQSLLDHATRLLDAPYGKVLSLQGEDLVISCYTSNQPFLAGDLTQRGDALLAWQAVDTLAPALVEDYAAWPHRRAIYQSVDLHAVITIPILSGDGQHCLGVIGLARDEPDRPFSPDEIETAQLFAQIAGLAIENVRLQSDLKEQSIRDPLTGLYNRRYLFETLHREVARAIREQVPISLILLDIDNFKHINDTYGHGAGDAALRAMAEEFKSMARSSDILCRYGGDEHMIVMYNSPAESALARAEQFRQMVAHLPVQYEDEVLNITISLGVAAFPDHGPVIDQVIACADRALYQSKSSGRNRATLYD